MKSNIVSKITIIEKYALFLTIFFFFTCFADAQNKDRKIVQICGSDWQKLCKTSKTYRDLFSCLNSKSNQLKPDCKELINQYQEKSAFQISDFKGICLDKINAKCSFEISTGNWNVCFQNKEVLELCQNQLNSHIEGINILCKKDIESFCNNLKERKDIDSCLLKNKTKLTKSCNTFFEERSNEINKNTDGLRTCNEQILKFCQSDSGKKINLNECAAKNLFFGECKDALKKLKILK